MPGRHEARLADPQRPSDDIGKGELVKVRVRFRVAEAFGVIVCEVEALRMDESEGNTGDEVVADPVVASDVLALAVPVGLMDWESEGVAVGDGDVELKSPGLACCVALGKGVPEREGSADSVVISVKTSLLEEVKLPVAVVVALGVEYAEEQDPKRSKHDASPQWSDVVPQYPYMLQHSGGGHAAPTAGPHCALEVIGIAVGVATGVSVGAEL